MSEQKAPGIYLIVDFDWPNPMNPDAGKKAYHLHQVVQNQSWIREVAAASGGLGEGPSSVWVFWLENYAALDRLLRDESDEISQAYIDCFSTMSNVSDKIREEVAFS